MSEAASSDTRISAFTSDQSPELSRAAQRAMPNREELERLGLNMLAMYCLRVAEAAASRPSDVEQARQLKAVWALYIGRSTSPIPGLDTLETFESYGKQLKQRMVSFLAEV